MKSITNVILYLFSVFALILSNGSCYEVLVISFLFLILMELEDKNHKDSKSNVESIFLDDLEK